MKKPKVSLIAAISANRVIGQKGQLPWYIPEDLKRFKALTTGHPIIMGRKTFQSIGRVLPNRTNIIVTKDPDFKVEGAVVVNSIDQALAKAQEVESDELFIIGGGEIYAQTIDLADKLYLTVVEGSIDGDVYFPEYQSKFNQIISQTSSSSDALKYTYFELGR